jgi:hypothetical protein
MHFFYWGHLIKISTALTLNLKKYSSVQLKRAKFGVHRRVRMKRAEFSTLSFTHSLEVNYFCQIADVVVLAGATPDTIFWLCTVEMD